MVKTTVYLDDDVVATLKGMAQQSSRPTAELIREALRTFAARNTVPPLPSGLGAFDSGHTDTASNRKELLRDAARAGRWR